MKQFNYQIDHYHYLTPMSEVAGKMSVQIGAQYLEKINGGKGILIRWSIWSTTR